MAAKITGKFEIDNNSFRFTAIAFGRIGGQNVGVKISKTTEKALEKLGYVAEDVIIKIQKNLLQGDAPVKKHSVKPSFNNQQKILFLIPLGE